MSITKLLAAEKVDPSEKLKAVAQIVAQARSAYGNEDTVIECPRVDTPHGSMPFNVLEDDSKVVVLRNEVAMLKAQAVEFAENYPGVNINKKLEELVAVNALLVNISAGTKFDYI